MNIIFFGPQASGKGTQSRILADKLGFLYLSTGDLFRNLSKTDSSVKKLVKSGGLPSDDLAFSLLKEYLERKAKNINNVVFDGYPRNVNQYLILKKFLKEKFTQINHAILLDISDKEALRRLSARRNCPECKEIYNLITNPPKNDEICDKCKTELTQREDDKPEAIKKRLFLYRKMTEPLIKVFEKEGILRKVDGERPIDTISKDILSLLQR